MSTFEESPLTGPLPPGSLPAPAPLVPNQAPAPGEPEMPSPGAEPVVQPGKGVSLAKPGPAVPVAEAAAGAGPAAVPTVAAPDPVALVPEPAQPNPADPELADPALADPELADPALPVAGRSRRVVAGLLAGVLLVGAVLAGALVYEKRVQAQDRAVDAARNQAVAVVRVAAPLLLSYDYRTLAADFAAGLAYTDGDFRKQYQQTTSTVVSPVAAQYKAVVRAQLVEVGVTSATADRVLVVAFVNQVTTSTRVTGTKLDQSRVRFELRRTGTAWKIVQVAAL